MKKLLLALVLMGGILTTGQLRVLAQDITGHTVMIVQTPIDSPGFQYVMYPDVDSGAADILFPISENGDVFDLWVTGTAWDDAVYLLDSKVVNAYSPAGSFAVTSEDTWIVGDVAVGNYIKRTRADRPYTITVNVSGLNMAVGAPQSASSVRLDLTGVNYTPSPDYSALGAVPYAVQSNTITSSQTWTHNNLLTPLGSTKAVGEEQWQLVRWADVDPVTFAVLVPETIINNVTVQVWPVSDVTLEGLTEGQEVLDSIPALSVQLKDVYPDSYTYCQIYKGGQVDNTVGTKISGSAIYYGAYYNNLYDTDGDGVDNYSLPTIEPQNPDKFFIDLNSVAATDGTYTIEVITETPFDARAPELLKWITFKVNRRTAVRGTLSSGN